MGNLGADIAPAINATLFLRLGGRTSGKSSVFASRLFKGEPDKGDVGRVRGHRWWVPFLEIALDSKFLSFCTSAKVKASRARELSKQKLQLVSTGVEER